MFKEAKVSEEGKMLVAVSFLPPTALNELRVANNASSKSIAYDYTCFKCQNSGRLLAEEETKLSGKLIINGVEQVDVLKNGFCCPHCQNDNVYINRDEMMDDVVVKTRDNGIWVDAGFFHADFIVKEEFATEEALIAMDELNFNDPFNTPMHHREVIRYVESKGHDLSPFAIQYKGGRRYKGLFDAVIKFNISIDPETKMFSLIEFNEKGDITEYDSLYLHDQQDAGAHRVYDTFKILPKLVQRMLMEVALEGVDKKVLAYKAFNLDDVTMATFVHVLTLSQIPQFQMFAGDIDMNQLRFSEEQIAAMKLAKNNVELSKVFLPKIGRKSAHTFNALLPRETSDLTKKSFLNPSEIGKVPFRNVYGTNSLALISNTNTLQNVLNYLLETGHNVRIDGELTQNDFMLHVTKSYDVNKLNEQLYSYLEEGALDQYFNDVLSGKAFRNEGSEGQKRAVRSLEELKLEGITKVFSVIYDLRHELFSIEAGLERFAEWAEGIDENHYEHSFYQDQLTILNELIEKVEKEGKFKSIFQLHKFTSSIVRRFVKDNTEYEYSTTSQQLKWKSENIEVSIPANTLELVDIAERFENCVVNYDYEVASDEYVIAEMKIDGVSELCIGMTVEYEIFEVKKKDNKLLDSSIKADRAAIAALQAYIDDKGLTSRTEDLQRTTIQAKNTFDLTFDQAN